MINTYEAVEEWIHSRPPVKRVSILSSCTKKKLDKPAAAEDLYLGQHHIRLMRGVRAYRKAGGEIDLRIVSAGYGIVPSERELKPYDVTFTDETKARIRARAQQLNIPYVAQQLLCEDFDLRFILLGDNYLDACAFNFGALPLSTPTIVMCSANRTYEMPDVPGLVVVPLGNRDATDYKCGLLALKGELAARLLTAAAEDLSASLAVRSSTRGKHDRLGAAESVDRGALASRE